MYPWEAAWVSDGEVTPYVVGVNVHTGEPMICLTGVIEQHITSDIIFALWQYYAATAVSYTHLACHNSTVVVTDNVVFGKISCPPGCGIGCRHVKFRRIFHNCRIAKWVCAIGICQCPVNILQAK